MPKPENSGDITARPASVTGESSTEKNDTAEKTEEKKHQAKGLSDAEAQILQGIKERHLRFVREPLPSTFDAKQRSLSSLYAPGEFQYDSEGAPVLDSDKTPILIGEKNPPNGLERAKEVRQQIIENLPNGKKKGVFVHELETMEELLTDAKENQGALERHQIYDNALRGYDKEGVREVEAHLHGYFNHQLEKMHNLHGQQFENLLFNLGPGSDGNAIDGRAAEIIKDAMLEHGGNIPGNQAQELLDHLQKAGVSTFAQNQVEALLRAQNKERQLLLSAYNAQIDKLNQRIPARVHIVALGIAHNDERNLAAQAHGNPPPEPYYFYTKPYNLSQLNEGDMPDWLQRVKQREEETFNRDGRTISYAYTDKKNGVGQFIVEREKVKDPSGQEGYTFKFNLEVPAGTPKKVEAKIWADKLAKAVASGQLSQLNLSKLDSKFGPPYNKVTVNGMPAMDYIAKRIWEVNPAIKLHPRDLGISRGLDDEQYRLECHALWCQKHKLNPGQANPIEKVELNDKDQLNLRSDEKKESDITVRPGKNVKKGIELNYEKAEDDIDLEPRRPVNPIAKEAAKPAIILEHDAPEADAEADADADGPEHNAGGVGFGVKNK